MLISRRFSNLNHGFRKFIIKKHPNYTDFEIYSPMHMQNPSPNINSGSKPAKFFKNKDAAYEAAIRNKITLPAKTSSIITLRYLQDVFLGTEYSLLNKDTKVVNCATPPKKEILIQYVMEELTKRNEKRTFSVDKSHTPDVIYLVTLLGSLNPKHKIFAKDYVPDPKDRGRAGRKAEIEVPENYTEPALGVFKSGLPSHLLYNPPSKSKKAKARQPDEESKVEYH